MTITIIPKERPRWWTVNLKARKTKASRTVIEAVDTFALTEKEAREDVEARYGAEYEVLVVKPRRMN